MDGRSYVAMYVKGKTKGRELVARSGCLIYLKRIHARCRDISNLTFDDLLHSKSEHHVFRLPDGTVTHSLNQTFRAFMRNIGLLKDSNTGQNRTLYSLRHSYICFRLSEGADVYNIAKNCRTSVEVIQKHYASHIKNLLDAAAINVRRLRRRPLREEIRPE